MKSVTKIFQEPIGIIYNCALNTFTTKMLPMINDAKQDKNDTGPLLITMLVALKLLPSVNITPITEIVIKELDNRLIKSFGMPYHITTHDAQIKHEVL